MCEFVDNGFYNEICCYRFYFNELVLEFNNDKIYENEVLGILMKY